MKDFQEKNPQKVESAVVSREWIAPEVTVLKSGKTEGGATLNTYEDAAYHS